MLWREFIGHAPDTRMTQIYEGTNQINRFEIMEARSAHESRNVFTNHWRAK